jgi:hypothetical protein
LHVPIDSAGEERPLAERRSPLADQGGDYRFDHLPAGRYLLMVQAVGYKSAGDSVSVAPSGETFHDIVLGTKVTQLDSVVATAASPARKYVSPALNGVAERRRVGQGHFVMPDELRKHDSDRLTAVLRASIPGLQIISVRGVDHAISGRNNDSGQKTFSNITSFDTPDGAFPFMCYVTIYLDGVLEYDYIQSVGPQSNSNTRAPGVPAPPRIDQYNVDQLGAVEYYAGDATLPPGFRSQRGCGVLMLWTREK